MEIIKSTKYEKYLEMTLQIGYYKINQQEKRKPSG
jgi:hypothetical protein